MTQIASGPPRQKAGRVKAKGYMGYIAALGGEQGAGCACGCGRMPCQVAHVKYSESCRNSLCGHGLLVDGTAGFVIIGPCEHCKSTGWRYGKVNGMKNDRFTLPLFHECHLMHEGAQHEHNEKDWWKAKGIDPLALCHRLQGIYDSNPLPRALELGTEAVLEVRRWA